MKKTLHTPGPWKIATFDGPNQYASIEAENENESVRICDIPSWPCAVYEMRANACLIASAPDLLDALQVCIDSFEKMIGISDFGSPTESDFPLKQAREAIRKAKGEA